MVLQKMHEGSWFLQTRTIFCCTDAVVELPIVSLHVVFHADEIQVMRQYVHVQNAEAHLRLHFCQKLSCMMLEERQVAASTS